MAAAIREQVPNTDVELIRGGRGVFTVTASGVEVWNKHQEGSFPDPNDVIPKLRELAADA